MLAPVGTTGVAFVGWTALHKPHFLVPLSRTTNYTSYPLCCPVFANKHRQTQPSRWAATRLHKRTFCWLRGKGQAFSLCVQGGGGSRGCQVRPSSVMSTSGCLAVLPWMPLCWLRKALFLCSTCVWWKWRRNSYASFAPTGIELTLCRAVIACFVGFCRALFDVG